ncbi:MAG: hypothetical protein E6J75_12885, partial [Deltaproteobacteria bacterium]
WDQNAGVDGTAATGNHFGATLATGDFNGDGFCDLGIGIPDEDLGTIVAAGAVQVLYGSPSGLRAANNQIWDQNKQGVEGFAAAGDRFGAALAAGDFDHDGFADLAIGVPGHDVGNAADAGAVNVLYGGPTGLSDAGNQLWSQRSVSVQGLAERGDHFGAALAAGDFDHDGFADLAIGVPDEDLGSIVDAGAVNVLFGGPRGISALRNQFWNQSRNLQGAAERGDHFGAALAAGDFNSDGFVDLAVGVPREDVGPVVDAGAVNVLYGTRHGLTFTGTQFWNQNRPGVLDFSERGDRFGSALTAGDFDGDGFPDLAIGVPGEDVGAIVDAGAVDVLHGGPHGLSAANNQFWTLDSPGVEGAAAAGDAFGAALAADDFNGDGFADLAIGVPGKDVGPIVDAGSVNVLHGGRSGLSAAGNQSFDADQLQAGPPPGSTTSTTTTGVTTTTTTTMPDIVTFRACMERLKKANDAKPPEKRKTLDVSDAVCCLPPKNDCKAVLTMSDKSMQPACLLGDCQLPRVIVQCGVGGKFHAEFTLCPVDAPVEEVELGMKVGQKLALGALLMPRDAGAPLANILNLGDSRGCSNVSCHAKGLPFPYATTKVGDAEADLLNPISVFSNNFGGTDLSKFVVCQDNQKSAVQNQVTLAGKKVILKAECLDAKCKCLADAIQNGQGQVGFPTDKAKLALALCNRLRLYVNGADQKTLGCE